MSTLPIFDYGTPSGDAADGSSDGEVPSASDAAAGFAGDDLAPPDGVDDLVSRSQWQWALGESERASPGSARAASAPAGDAGDAADASADLDARPAKIRPSIRARPRAPAASPDAPPRGAKFQLPEFPAPSRPAAPDAARAKAAVAQAQIDAMRDKLRVVERLMDRPAESRDHLASLVAGMTGEEFLGVCEERCLAGTCGWPMCGEALTSAQTRGNERVLRVSETTGAGSVTGGRGKYRIAAGERKVYLRRDLEMFCCEEHRLEAEALGTSLAVSLEEARGEKDVGEGGADAGRGGAEENKAGNKAKSAGAARSPSAAARERAVGDLNVNVKMDVVEKYPPNRAGAPAPRPPTMDDADRSASAVEGYVPRAPVAVSARVASAPPPTKGALKTERRSAEKSGKGAKGVVFSEELEMGPTGSAFAESRAETKAETEAETETGTTPSTKPSTSTSPSASSAVPAPCSSLRESSLGAKALDEAHEAARAADDSTLTVGGGGAQFYFNVFQEGIEKAAKGGANVMGTFSEGQLTRVVPDAFADAADAELASDDDANDHENAGDAANDVGVKDAMATAMAAAEAAAKAAEVAGPEDEAAARAALANAREALRVALLRAGADGDGATDGETTDGETTDGDVTDDESPASAPPVSEFGATWMMLDGWVTRATFAHVAGEEPRVAGDGSDASEASELPPRGGFASQMSDAAATNISRALPGVCAALGLRASASALERPLGKLLRTFFFRSAAPSLRPARWAFVTAIMLEAAAGRMARETPEGHAPPALVEDVARAVADGSMAKLENAAGATPEERETFLQLLRGECAGGR